MVKCALAAAFFIFSLFSPLNLYAANTTTQAVTKKTQAQPKTPLPKIDIKKITLESEEKGAVPSGLPLMVLVEVSASEDFASPFVVNLELKKGTEKQKFTEGIEKLKQGSNSFKWDLTSKPEDGPYTLSVEVVNEGLKLKDKSSKVFRVGEKPAPQTITAKKTTLTTATTSAVTTATATNVTTPATTTTATTTNKTTSQSTKKSTSTKAAGTGTTTGASTVTTTAATTTATTNATTPATTTTKVTSKSTQKSTSTKAAGTGTTSGVGTTTTTTTTTKASSSTGATEIKEITMAGVKLTGTFTQQSAGVYLATGEIKPDWSFDIKLNAKGQLTIDTNQKKITGQLTIHVPVFGDIGQITDLIIATNQIKFNGVVVEAFKIGPLTIQIAQATATFDLSRSKIAAKAGAGVGINVTGIPGITEIDIKLEDLNAGFETPILPPEMKVEGAGTVEIPPTPVTPPIKVDLSGDLTLSEEGLSGTGKAKVFDIEVGNGTFNINTKGIISLTLNAGVFKEGVIECNVAGTTMTVDMPKKLLTAGLSQEVKLFDTVTIPGSCAATLTVDGKTKTLTVSGKAGIPLTGGVVGPEELSLGIKNFLFEATPYNSTTATVKLSGDAYVSLWTLAGFSGTITNAVLDGKGNLNLPPGLNKLIGINTISLPVRVDLRSGQTIAQLGGKVAGLFIKHFPLETPEVIVKNDGVHLKGQIGISHVITIPLGDLVFKKDESYTTINGDIGIGPFTVAEGSFILPANDNEGIGFSGKMGIPGLSSQKISGNIYNDGKVDLAGVTKIGLITVDSLAKFAVSTAGLHADTAGFSVGLGGLAKCALTFTSLDITKSLISGTATGRFTGVLGINEALSGNFSFDGQTVELTYPSAVSLCGISVGNAKLRIGIGGVTGSGTISAAGQSKTVSITIENGIMRLKGPLGELIAEGLGIANKLKDTVAATASQEASVVGEDADKTLDNLSRMSDPWIKDATAAATTAKNFFKGIEKIVSDEVISRVKSVLDHLKEVIDVAVGVAKKAIAAAVDGLCDGVIALIDGVKGIFSDIESLIPANYLDAYKIAKAKVLEKADTLRQKVTEFRDNTKASLYDLTGTITKIYQTAIDLVTGEANKVASAIKKQVEPIIKEIDQLLTEIGQEVDAAKNAVGDEATQHYNVAKQKANLVKEKANNVINNYKNKIADLITPYIQPIIDKLTPYVDQVAKVRDEVIAQGLKGVETAWETIKPVIKPFEDAVKELNDLLEKIGGAAFQKFLQGVGKAGDALNKGLGLAGKGLVKATDFLGDGVVAASNAAANLSQAAHGAATAVANATSEAAGAVASGASAAVNFAQETGSQAVNVAVNTAQQGYQTASDAASQAASAASSAASQAYSTASQAYNSAQQQVTSTVNNVISHMPSISPSSFATGSPVSFSQIQSGAQTVSTKVNEIVNTLSNYASAAYNTASSAASSAGSAISSGASAVASGASSAWSGAKNKISGLFGGGGGSSSPPPPDYTAPTISNVSATSTTNSITVNWTTSFNARTIMFYSTESTIDPNGSTGGAQHTVSVYTGNYYPETTSHTITVSGLNPGTTYYYMVYSYRMVSGQPSDVAKQGVYSIVTQPTTAIVGGTIKDAQNNALSGANICLNGTDQVVATTGATGQYAVEVNPGTYTITAKKYNYLGSSTTTPSLTAGQIIPLDFTLADGKIYISGSVKEAASETGISSASVKLLGPSTTVTTASTTSQSADHVGHGSGASTTQTVTPTIAQTNTDSSGAFSFVVEMYDQNPMQFTINASKDNYTPYASTSMTLSRGSKMQNVEIRLPHTPPALSGDVSVLGIYATQATISFDTQNTCSAFVQFGQQSSANYLYQTPAKTNKNSFYFDLISLSPATTYKYKVVLQDNSGNTVVAKEGVFTTSQPVIGLSATVDNITGNNAKLNINSTSKILQHQLVLRDTTTNTQILNQDLHVLASPVTLDLTHLIDGHNYTVELTSSLLANSTTGNAIKTETKNVTFSTIALPDFKIISFTTPSGTIVRGTTSTINLVCAVRINHAIANATLKILAGTTEIFSQTFASFNPGDLQLNIPMAVSSIPGTDVIPLKLSFQAGAKQEETIKNITIVRPQQAAEAQAQQQPPKTKTKATAQ